jgi:hypothetical protein
MLIILNKAILQVGGVVPNREVLKQLEELLNEVNPFVNVYKTMEQLYNEHVKLKLAEDPNRPIIEPKMYMVQGPDPRRYNMPVNAADIGVVFVGKDAAPPDDVYLRVYPTGNALFLSPKKHVCKLNF